MPNQIMEQELKRDLKTPGAILMGLGSIVGTGIFVSIAIATLGEEVDRPRTTIPRAIILVMICIVILYLAVRVTGGVIGLLVLSGDVVFTWSFSAFTVLIYYAITNLSAFFMPAELRLYPRWIPAMGLFGCLFLAFWIDPKIWISELFLLGVGIIWHVVALKIWSADTLQ